MGTVPGDKMTLGEIIHELKTMYCKLLVARVSKRANYQATISVFSMSTSPTEDSATGSVNESRSRNSGNTLPKKSE